MLSKEVTSWWEISDFYRHAKVQPHRCGRGQLREHAEATHNE
jgi:hypothetical protein